MNTNTIARILIVFLLFFSCKKQNEVIPQRTNSPYSFTLPLHFSNLAYNIPMDNPLTTEGVQLGRMLFYDKKLSSDNTISCASCHIQKFAFTDTASFSKGVNNKLGKRNAMSIVNLVFQESNFFWDGRTPSLEEQVLFPLHDSLEMNANPDEIAAKLNTISDYKDRFKLVFGSETVTKELIYKAIAQFERTIVSTNSKFDQYILGKTKLTDQELRGFTLFRTHPIAEQGLKGGNCGDCHNTVTFTEQIANFRNNGLDAKFTDLGRQGVTNNTFDAGKFRVPSLRNIAVSAPYMHDGRFNTLEEVLDHYNDHVIKSSTLDPLISAATNEIDGKKLALTTKEKEDIIAFLHTLTDESLLSNEAYSNPFK